MSNSPHFVLFSGIGKQSDQHERQGGIWHFQLESTSDGRRFEASDMEVNVSAERLELLAVVRGLEALEQPSRVTLMTPSRVVTRGIRHDLAQWREDGWTWERFGERVPIKNRDLWQRVDRALQIHQVSCRRVRVDPAHAGTPGPHTGSGPHLRTSRRRGGHRPVLSGLFSVLAMVGGWLADALHRTADGLQRILPENHPKPHPLL